MAKRTLTPMLKQYLAAKEAQPQALLFFRMGDFYEMFFEDAVTAARELDIALTSRDKDKSEDNAIPMCGVPYHSATGYVQTLLDKGYAVAICEQVQDPKASKGLVDRRITRVLTPGIAFAAASPDGARAPHYLAALWNSAAPGSRTHRQDNLQNDSWGLAVVDFGTGDFQASEVSDAAALETEILRLAPKEIVVAPDCFDALPAFLANGASSTTGEARWTITVGDAALFGDDAVQQVLADHFREQDLAALGLAARPLATHAVGALLGYLRATQGGGGDTTSGAIGDSATSPSTASPTVLDAGRILEAGLEHLTDLRVTDVASAMIVDDTTRRNLELTYTLREGRREGSLLGLLDDTVSAGGSRLLTRWLAYPLMDPAAIAARHDAVEELIADGMLRDDIRTTLTGAADLDRLAGKIAAATVNARDCTALAATLAALPALRKRMEPCGSAPLRAIHDDLDELQDTRDLLDRAIQINPPASLRDGGFIAEGYSAQLDEYRTLSRDSKAVIAKLEATERERTGIKTLKVGYNRVFGYYIEITKAHGERVPEHYIRKQTLVNAERYITPELKEYEEKILTATEKSVELEYRLFQELRTHLLERLSRLKRNAALLAELDVLAAFAEIAQRYRYTRPIVNTGDILDIRGGRHAVVERMLPATERFVPNDVRLTRESEQLLIITGPNMAGKSTVMREVALIVVLAQMGGFVPAESATIGVVDRIFTRVGASDSLTTGRSTFMVEMSETADILRHATARSLVLLDEIGRGTSTFDGLSIAWAVAEALHDGAERPKTLFATHYHELTDLALTKPRVKNYHIAVKEWNDDIIFLRRLAPGGTSRSYGIQVARLAGIPDDVVGRAKEILHNLEAGELREGLPAFVGYGGRSGVEQRQLSLLDVAASGVRANDPVREEIIKLDIESLTPLEALQLLHRFKAELDDE